MMGITGVCYRLVGDIAQALGVLPRSSSYGSDPNPSCKPRDHEHDPDDFMVRALASVFGMENNGKIKKERARSVVEQLGLMYVEEEEKGKPGSVNVNSGTTVEDGVPVAEVLSSLEDGTGRHELLHQAFKIFDEDGNGYIDAVELKRVLQCLGLDKGWDIKEIQNMLRVADLNLDGKVDFNEFELMMS
ncbi:hypothetical protein K2173_000473 [Erythroxylum novogranatense]|uniref:EF-hand domain-containing protein n=1 Tax=Erythroxylum novogranatense TaxID=1862640 RepID=A0AAV8SWC2_9ROSI|nr:hypothetical protein K2173_000473 [Erythroxylum novogranatense]